MLSFSTISLAQVNVSGIIHSEKEPLLGATAQLYRLGDGQFFGSVTDNEGKFLIENVDTGRYNLITQFLGFEKLRTRIEVGTEDIDVGAITLVETTVMMNDVEITGTMVQAIQRGDTTAFNAEAFKVLPDADAEDLIKKLPGITIENGVIKAMGENVNRVTVDGREFFGNDPNAALKALPAEVIDKIEVIDEQSESSQFSGFNDGNTTKTINIVTKVDKRNGQFGKLYAGYGEDNRYQAGGNVNIFAKQRRVSLIGMSNNINQQNFAADDISSLTGRQQRRGGRRGGRGRGESFQVGNQNGITNTNSVGINFSDKWGEKAEMSASYFVNHNNNDAIEDIDRTFFNEEVDGDFYGEDNVVNSKSFSNRLQGRININPDRRTRIRLRPRFSWQKNNSTELANTDYITRNEPISTQNNYDANAIDWTLSNSIRISRRLEKRGRVISFGVDQSYNPLSEESLLNYDQQVQGYNFNEEQFTSNKNITTEYEVEASYSEPVGKTGALSIEYEFGIEKDKEDLSTYEGLDENGEFLNNLSNDLETKATIHRPELGYRLRHKTSMFMLRSGFEFTNLQATQAIPISNKIDKNFFNIVPMAMIRHNFSKTTNLRMFYRSSTQNPSANQLSETINNNNPVQLSIGNPNLDQGYTHRLFARFNSTMPKSGIVFFSYLGGSYSSNFIGSRTYNNGQGVSIYDELGIDKRAQLTIPENLDGQYAVNSFFTVGFPLQKIKSKLNFNVSGNYSNTPSIINDLDNRTKDFQTGLGISLVSNISDKVDFTIGTTSNIGTVNNELQENLNSNYLNQNTSLKLEVIFPWGITWRNNFVHQFFNGYGEGVDGGYLLATMSVGKKFLPKNRAEVSLSVFDLFNQNQSISRNIASNYVETVESNVLQRYFMVNLRYDLRNFGSAPKQESREERMQRMIKNGWF